MRNPAKETIDALKIVLLSKKSRKWFALLAFFAFITFILIPIFTIPENDLRFYLTILRPIDYAIYAFLSLVIAAVIMMQVYLFKQSRDNKKRLASTVQGGVGAYSAMLGGLLATAACSSCIAGLLGFLGVGSVLFVAQNNVAVAGVALLISLFSLYMSSRKVNGYCKRCETVCK